MKRITAFILVIIMLLPMTILTGCNQSLSTENKTRIVCTFFPHYDWVRNILGDNAADIELTLLLDNSIDLHSYQPTVEDIAKISSCDLFIYIGGESDAWVEDALKSAINKDMLVINLLEILGESAKEEEIKEGMEHEHEEHAHDTEFDEHVWLSLKNVLVFCPVIADALSLLNPASADIYKNNSAAYIEKLSALDAEYQSTVNAASVRTLLFGDRFPFRYLVDDYGLDYFAAFSGCSAETEASFETIIFLAGKTNELGLQYILVTESSDQLIATTVKNNTTAKNQIILVLDSMQSVSNADIANGLTYLSVMENNLNVLKDVLI